MKKQQVYIWISVLIAAIFIVWAFMHSSSNNQNGHTNADASSVATDAPVLGSPDAPVTIVEYGDFQCPVCNSFFHNAEPQIREQYVKTGKVKLVWRDFAFIGPDSERAAEAAQCAGAQGKFWEYHDALYNYIWDNYYAKGISGENAGAFPESRLKDFAAQLGLDTDAFNTCYDAGDTKSIVDEGKSEGIARGVRGTPTLFVGGQEVVGAQPFSVFDQIIKNQLP